MKGGIAAAVEAMRAIRDAGGADYWRDSSNGSRFARRAVGDGHQLDQMLLEGYVGDAAIIPKFRRPPRRRRT